MGMEDMGNEGGFRVSRFSVPKIFHQAIAKWRGAHYRRLRQKSRQSLQDVAIGADVAIATVFRAEKNFNLRSAAHRRIASYLTGRDVA